MPAARVVVNTPSTHGAIGFSTALAPSMTLGCGSWGGNVTSDNISPLHLMDIKRVAFETRSVTAIAEAPVHSVMAPPQPAREAVSTQPQIDQTAIASLVDRFLAARKPQGVTAQTDNPTPRESAPAADNHIQSAPPPSPAPPSSPPMDKGENNGRRAVDFVCEEDVRRAIATGEKIYINAKTIVTPAARDLGEQREVFAKSG
jgi:acetaldehyde dehydrogenase (acetylating)